MRLFVTIVDSWNLLTSVSSSLEPTWLNYDIQITEEGCSNVISNPKCNQDFNETILENLSMSEKAIKMLLYISGNVNAVARLAWIQPSFLKNEFY